MTSITAKEAAAVLDGSEVGKEGAEDLFDRLHGAWLVAAFGHGSYFKMRGSFLKNLEAKDGQAFFLSRTGLEELDACPKCRAHQIRDLRKIVVRRSDAEEGPDWRLETDIPHQTFQTWETDQQTGERRLSCVGIVFDRADLSPLHL